MTFTARLKRSSHIYSSWRGARQIQGIVGNAVFRLAPGFDYVTQTLTPDQIDELRHHPSVTLEMTGVTPADIVVDDAVGVDDMVEFRDGNGTLAGAITNADAARIAEHRPRSVPQHPRYHQKGHRK